MCGILGERGWIYMIPGEPLPHGCCIHLYTYRCRFLRPTAHIHTFELAVSSVASENDFKELDTLRRDPDLEPVRGAELEALLFKWAGLGGGWERRGEGAGTGMGRS